MTTIVAPGILIDHEGLWSAAARIGLLVALGLLSFAAVGRLTETPEHEDCKPFTTDVSAVGSCDWIGLSP